MIYLKINDEIRQLILLISFKLGCKEFCKYQLIALDEFELLRKELERNNLKTLSENEYKILVKSTETVYFHDIHFCEGGKEDLPNESEPDMESVLENLKKDKVHKTNKNKPYFEFESYIDDSITQDKSNTSSEILKIRNESTLSYAFSMISSLFLLSLGAYYLGKYFLQMNDSNTYKLVLVVTIIVLISEMILLVLKMNRESEKKFGANNKLIENSFAYKFNKKYRDQLMLSKNKPTIRDPKPKKD